MNERIQELAEQAGLHDFVLEAMGIGEEFEKFAELIIQEMLVTCEEHPAWTGRMIGEQIKEHFGVQE
jgi:hypothetical protein